MISTNRCANGFSAEVAGPKGCGFFTGRGFIGFAGIGVPTPTISASLPVILGLAIIQYLPVHFRDGPFGVCIYGRWSFFLFLVSD
jgi:hypothetical protein